MLFIPGFLIGWVTFPGVVIHEYAHKKACEWRNISVHEVNYFSLDGGGYVKHRSPRRFEDTLAISAAPFAVNTVFAFALYLLTFALFGGSTVLGANSAAITEYLALGSGWLAVSIGWHAIPSFGDAGHIWKGASSRWRSSNLALFSLPLVGFFYLGNLLAFFWFDALYSMGIGFVAYTIFLSSGAAIPMVVV